MDFEIWRSYRTRYTKTKVTQYAVSSVRWDTYFKVNLDEHKELNQTTAELSFEFLVFNLAFDKYSN